MWNNRQAPQQGDHSNSTLRVQQGDAKEQPVQPDSTHPPPPSYNDVVGQSNIKLKNAGSSNSPSDQGSSTYTGQQRKGMNNFQTARYVETPKPSTYDVPLHRQLATIQNANQARLIRSLNLCRETHRYQTFNSDWPLDSAPSGRAMAASGWFYLGNLDRTQCFSCGGVLRNWRRLDNPNTEHTSHFPHCSMAQGRESRNIPDINRQGSLSTSPGMNELTLQQRSDLRIMFPCEFPVTPSMKTVGERLKSFKTWYFTRATPQTMAEAGLYAMGIRDQVKCFYCNGGLHNWRQNDNPWEEHAKWYPTCEFLLQQRGPEYIHTIVARFPNINRPILHAPGHDVPPGPQVSNGAASSFAAPSQKKEVAVSSRNPATAQESMEAAMKSDVVEVITGMGFEQLLVRDVTRAKIEECGTGYQSATALLEAVEEAQRHLEKKNEENHLKNRRRPERYLSETFASDVEMEDDQSNIYDSTMEQNVTDISYPAETPSAPSSSSAESTNRLGSTSAKSCNIEGSRSEFSEKPCQKTEVDFEKLGRTLQQLEEEKRCKVCLNEDADMVYIPCGHICCCIECTRALKRCPICRKKIVKAMRINKT